MQRWNSLGTDRHNQYMSVAILNREEGQAHVHADNWVSRE